MPLRNLIVYTFIVSISYFLSAKLVSPLSLSESDSIFAIWPPTGIALSFLLFRGRIVLPGIFLGAFLLNLTLSSPLVAFEIAIGNTVGPYIVYWLIKNHLNQDILHDTQSIINFIAFSLLGSVITSGLGIYALHLNGLLSSEHQILGWMTWLFGDLIGFLLITSLYISFSIDRKYNKSLEHSFIEVIIMVVLLIFISMVVFGSGLFFAYKYPIEYLILFPLLWASIRFKPGINLIFLFLITTLAIIGTASGHSHFSMENKKESLILLQFFIFTITFAVLLMTAQRHQMLRVLYEKEQLSLIDPLTDIGNRRYFLDMLNREYSINARYKRPLSIIMFDIDHFKNINDTYGHDKGDAVLKDISQEIKSKLRASDNFARWGGEEFMILLPETNLDDACNVAEKLRIDIQKYDFKFPQNVTCSFGVTEFKKDESHEDIIKRVDTLLYNAKSNGRNRVECKS